MVSSLLNHLKRRSLGHDGVQHHVPNRQHFFLLSLGCLPAPSNKMPSPPFRRFVGPLVQSKTNINSQSVAIAPSPPSFPLKYGAPFAVYGSILDLYGAATTSFDLAVQQQGNNSGRSLKGERLWMSLGSVLRLCVLNSENYSSPAKIARESQWQH